MSLWGNLLRRARIRGVKEGKVQTARAEALENDAKDNAERWQDYGFAGQPGDGQGLTINAGGHTVVIRLDRIAERPQLDLYEVAVWHKEGHFVKLKAGKLVEVSCDSLIVTAAVQVRITSPVVQVDAGTHVQLNTPTVDASAAVTAGTNITAAGDVADAGGTKTMAGMREVFNGHVHVEHNVDGGSTDEADTPM